MNTPVREAPVTYSGLLKPQNPGVLGMSAGQFMALVIIAFPFPVMLLLGQGWLAAGWVILGLLLWLPWVIGGFFNKNPYSWVAQRVLWRRAEKAGRNILWQGPVGLSERGKYELPGLLSTSDLYEAHDTYGVPMGIIHHAAVNEYTIVVECHPDGTTGLDQSDIDALAANWGGYLNLLSQTVDIVGAQVVVDTVPDTGVRLRQRAMKRVADDAPSFAKDVLSEVVDDTPLRAAQINTSLTLTFRGVGPRGRKITPEQFAERVSVRIPNLLSALHSTGAGSASRVLTPSDIIDRTREAFDPSVAREIETARTRHGESGIRWDEVGPTRAHNGMRTYSHDGYISCSYVKTSPPVGEFQTLTLQGLLVPNALIARKRVALLYRPMSPEESKAAAQWRVRGASSSMDTKRSLGPSATSSAALIAARNNEAAQSRGASFVRVGMVITGTVEAGSDVETFAANMEGMWSGLNMTIRPALGYQDVAFMASLPLGIVLHNRVKVPGFIRDSL